MFKKIGKVSTRCEVYGVDFMWGHADGLHGVQRKTVQDLLASVSDGRLQREVGQALPLITRHLILEGRVTWTNEGVIAGWGSRWTARQWTGLLASVSQTFAVIPTDNHQQTIWAVEALYEWTAKEHHRTLATRPGPQGAWGKPTNREYQVHLVQGLPNVGVELATRIVETLGVPFTWKVTAEDLVKIPGIGKKKAQQIMECLGE